MRALSRAVVAVAAVSMLVGSGSAFAAGTPDLAASQSSHLPGFGAHDVGLDGLGSHARQRGPRDGAPPSKQQAITDRLAREAAGISSAGKRPDGAFPQLGSEIPGFRTETSKTFATDNQGYVTRVYPTPVNFRAANGSLQPIDSTLVRTAEGYSNRADRSDVVLPARLGDRPVSVSVPGGGTVSMTLQGARDAAVDIDASKARYADVLAQTSLLYEVLPGGLKESLELASKDAPASFRFDLTVSAGLSARLAKDQSVRILDNAGDEVFKIDPPTMHDGGKTIGVPGPIEAELSESASGYEYLLKPDARWLADEKRDFPVIVDPTVNVGGEQCTIIGPPYQDYGGNCTRTEGFVGTFRNQFGFYDIRSLQRYFVDSVPADSVILGSRLALNVTAQQTQSAMSVDVRQLGKSFTQGQATWARRDTANVWATPGGDFDDSQQSPVARQTISGLGWKYFDLTALTQGWVDGSVANNGIALKATNESGANDFTFPANGAVGSPYLEIQYQSRFGDRRGATQVRTPLTDRSSMSVNVANGNLMVQAEDLNVAGTAGLENTVSRTYNSLDPGYGSFGQSWVTGLGRYPYIAGTSNNSIYYVGPDGGFHLFNANPGSPSGYNTPPGLDATLCYVTSGPSCPALAAGEVATLTFRDGTKYVFGTNSALKYGAPDVSVGEVSA